MNIIIILPSEHFLSSALRSSVRTLNKNRDDHKKQDPTHLQVTTEEERLGLTKGDSNNASSDEDEPLQKTFSHSAEELRSIKPGQASSDQRRWNTSSPEIRTPGNGRPLPEFVIVDQSIYRRADRDEGETCQTCGDELCRCGGFVVEYPLEGTEPAGRDNETGGGAEEDVSE